MKTKIYFLPISIFLFLGTIIPNHCYAQENTKQRTTGTYLPNITGQKKEQVADIKKDSNFQLDDGSIKIEIPANVYSKTLRFGIRRIPWSNNTAIPTLKISNETFIGKDVFEITSVENDTGKPVLNFDKNISITFRYLDEDIKNIKEETLKLRYFDRLNQIWTEIPITKKDANSNSINIKTDHLTLFSITGETTKSTSIFSGTNNQSNSVPWWQTTLLVIGIIVLLSIGGWYGYTAYTEAVNEIKLEENEISIAGGDPDNLSQLNNNQSTTTINNPTTNNQVSTTNSFTNNQNQEVSNQTNPEKKDEEIWIDF